MASTIVSEPSGGGVGAKSAALDDFDGWTLVVPRASKSKRRRCHGLRSLPEIGASRHPPWTHRRSPECRIAWLTAFDTQSSVLTTVRPPENHR